MSIKVSICLANEKPWNWTFNYEILTLEHMEEKPFLYLSVDLPPPPLFRDEIKESIIPQVPLMQILSKFDGVTEQEYKTYKENYLKRYEITKLPKFLIMCFRVCRCLF